MEFANGFQIPRLN